MKTYTFAKSESVDSGVVMFLTGAQAVRRAHFLTPSDPELKGTEGGWHKKGRADGRRLPFIASQACTFKQGETIGLEVAPTRLLQSAFTNQAEPPAKPEKLASNKAAKAEKAAETKAVRSAIARAETAEAERDALRDEVTVLEGLQSDADSALSAAHEAAEGATARAEAAESEWDSLREQLATLGERLVRADAALSAAETAVKEAGEGADLAALDATFKAAEDELGDVEQTIAAFLKGFVAPASDTDAEDGA